MKHHFTDTWLQRLQFTKQGQRYISDSSTPGFGVRVGRSTKTFMVNYVIAGTEKQIRQAIGRYPHTSLKTARQTAVRVRETASAGIDPLGPSRDLPRLSALSEEFLPVAEQKYSARYYRDTKKYLEVVLDRLPNKRIDQFNPVELTAAWSENLERGEGSMANNYFYALKALLRYAELKVEWQFVSPMNGMPQPSQTKQKERWLDQGEIKIVWKACDKIGYPYGRFIQFNIASAGAGRLTDYQNMQADHFGGYPIREAQTDCWDVFDPTKSKTAHVVPMTDLMQQCLSDCPDEGYLWSTTGGEKPFSGFTKMKARLDKKYQLEPWTPHDIRRTASTHFADYLELPPYVIEQIQNRRTGDVQGVVRTYNRARYLPQKLDALSRWGEYVERLVA